MKRLMVSFMQDKKFFFSSSRGNANTPLVIKQKILNLLRNLFKISLLENLLVYFTIGKEYGRFVTKLPPHHYQYNKNSVRHVTRHGINYCLDISDIIDWYIYYGFKEKSRTHFYELIKTGHQVIDIGANNGDVSLHAARLLAGSGYVYSFEPDPWNFKRFMENLSLNNLKNITAYNMGIGNSTGTADLAVIDDRNRGMNRISSFVNEDSPFNPVEIIRLDDFVQQQVSGKIDIVKIDVEGYEMKVLEGAKVTIETHGPILFIELDDSNLKEQGSSAAELIAFLERRNYQTAHAETHESIVSSMSFSLCHFDIIATPITGLH